MQERLKIVGRVRDWFYGRYQGLPEVLRALLKEPIPRQPSWWYLGLGGTVLFLIIVQVITGALLSLYYKPTPEEAYKSVLYIMSEVRFGWLIRSIHSWAGQIIVIVVILHGLRVFFTGSYKAPRELTWVMGVLLLFVVLGFAFTGYLLPWDQRSYWATTVGTQMAGAVPGVGKALLSFLRGGLEVTDLTLLRFFSAHMAFLPAALGLLVVIHILFVRLQGVSPPSGNEEVKG